MQENAFDLIHLVIGSLTAALTSASLFFSAFIFTRKDFKDRKIFKYIAANSAVDGLLFILATLFPIFFFVRKKIDSIKVVDHFVIKCFGSSVKKLSENLSLAIAVYRFLGLSGFQYTNTRVSFKLVFVGLIFLSFLMTIHVYVWKTVVQRDNGTIQVELVGNSSFLGFNYIQTSIYYSSLISIINILLILLSNAFIVFKLIKLYLNRRYLIKLSSSQAQRFLTENDSQASKSCFKLLCLTNQEIRMSLLIVLISILFVLNMMMKHFSIFVLFFLNVNSSQQENALFINHYGVCFLNLLNVVCYYNLSNDFRKNVKKIFCSNK